MLLLEIKIFILTCIYFIGWFVFEKIFSNLWERWEAATPEEKKKPVAKIAPVGTVTPLDQTSRYIKGLKSPDWRIRRISCIQLGEKRGTAVVNALLEALSDPKEEVSMAASESLAKIGDPAAIVKLSEYIQRLDRKMEEHLERYRAA